MDSGWFVVMGAVIGGMISLIPALLQTRAQARSERARQVVELAMEDFRRQLERGTPGGLNDLVPLACLVNFYRRILVALEHGPLDRERYNNIRRASQSLYDDKLPPYR